MGHIGIIKSREPGVIALCSQGASPEFLGRVSWCWGGSGLEEGGGGQLEEREGLLINICNQQGAGKESLKACCFVKWRQLL